MDLLLPDAWLTDGTGSAARAGDVAVAAGRIARLRRVQPAMAPLPRSSSTSVFE